jgi:hypothetical protein
LAIFIGSWVPVPSLNKNQLPLRPATAATSAFPDSKSLIKSIGSLAAQPTEGLPPAVLPLPAFPAGAPPVAGAEPPVPATVAAVPALGVTLPVPPALLAEPP